MEFHNQHSYKFLHQKTCHIHHFPLACKILISLSKVVSSNNTYINQIFFCLRQKKKDKENKEITQFLSDGGFETAQEIE